MARKITQWTFLSNHAHVLLCLAQDPTVRLREVAQLVGITERAVFKIVAELEAAGIVSHVREGRRNRYAIRGDARLRHPLEAAVSVGRLLSLLLGTGPADDAPEHAPGAG